MSTLEDSVVAEGVDGIAIGKMKLGGMGHAGPRGVQHGSRSGWDYDRETRLRALWADGLSASQIAERIGGMTRNAVIGKVHRLGLPGRAKSPTNRATRKIREPRAPKPQTQPRLAHGGPRILALPTKPEIPEETPAPGANARTFLTLEAGECKFPLGDPRHADFHFCGNPAPTVLPYCAGHARIAYQAGTRR